MLLRPLAGLFLARLFWPLAFCGWAQPADLTRGRGAPETGNKLLYPQPAYRPYWQHFAYSPASADFHPALRFADTRKRQPTIWTAISASRRGLPPLWGMRNDSWLFGQQYAPIMTQLSYQQLKYVLNFFCTGFGTDAGGVALLALGLGWFI